MPFLATLEEESQVVQAAQESDNFVSGHSFYIIPPEVLMLDILSSSTKFRQLREVLSTPHCGSAPA